MVTLLLNILCEKGFSTVSWMIVLIPFILMTVIVTLLLYMFNTDASANELKTDSQGNIIIYDPDYVTQKDKVYYNYPNIIVPNPNKKTN